MSETNEELRESLDGSDVFMSGGHQILKVRRGRKRGVPEWAKTDAAFKALVYKMYPMMFKDAKQRKLAARCTYIAYHYYRASDTAQGIADELGVSREVVKVTLRRLGYVAAGRWKNGRGRFGERPVGRPKKQVSPSEIGVPTPTDNGREQSK